MKKSVLVILALLAVCNVNAAEKDSPLKLQNNDVLPKETMENVSKDLRRQPMKTKEKRELVKKLKESFFYSPFGFNIWNIEDYFNRLNKQFEEMNKIAEKLGEGAGEIEEEDGTIVRWDIHRGQNRAGMINQASSELMIREEISSKKRGTSLRTLLNVVPVVLKTGVKAAAIILPWALLAWYNKGDLASTALKTWEYVISSSFGKWVSMHVFPNSN